MKKLHLLCVFCAGVCLFLSSVTSAALINNGGGLIYDDVLDITWSQPAPFTNWDAAVAWADGLTLGGATGWRLPYISVAAGDGPFTGTVVNCRTAGEVACRDNELGYMFYHNLGGTFGKSIFTSGDPDLALFPTLIDGAYWSATEYDATQAWGLTFRSGGQGFDSKSTNTGVWAVHAGNITGSIGAVPVPAAVWLFGSGLIGLVGLARGKRLTIDDSVI